MSSDGSPIPHPRPGTPERTLADVRKRLMNAIVVVVAVAGIPVVATSLYRGTDIGFRPVMAIQVVAIMVFLVLAALRQRLPFAVLSGALFFLIPLNAAAALLSFGLIGQGTVMILAWATVVAIFVGLRLGAAAAVTGVTGIAVCGIAVAQGWITFDLDMNAYSIAASSWINAVVGCAFWSFLTAGCVGASHREMVGALRASEERAVELEVSNERLRDLASQLVAAEDSERRRLAGVLHDGVGQKLYAAKVRLGAISLAEERGRPAPGFDEVLRLLDETIEHTRDLTQELFPQILYQAGLVAGLEWLADQHRRLHGTAVEFTASRPRVEVADDVAITLFQATRELLHNVAKHARADSVQIGIALRCHEVEITVADDGVGLDPDILETYGEKHMSFGLFNIRERLEHVGGRLEIHPRRGGGTKAVVIAPARPTAAEAP